MWCESFSNVTVERACLQSLVLLSPNGHFSFALPPHLTFFLALCCAVRGLLILSTFLTVSPSQIRAVAHLSLGPQDFALLLMIPRVHLSADVFSCPLL